MNTIGLTIMSQAITHFSSKMSSQAKSDFSSLEPFSCCVRIALLPLLPHGTKLGFSTVRLKFHLPEVWQGIVRWKSGDSRRDVDRLMKPILRMIERCDPERDAFLLERTRQGLLMLMETYSSDGGTIAYTIRMYCALIQSRLQGQEIDLTEPSADIYGDLWKAHEITLISNMLLSAYDENSSKATTQSHIMAIKSLLHSKESEAKTLFHNFCSQL